MFYILNISSFRVTFFILSIYIDVNVTGLLEKYTYLHYTHIRIQ